MSSVLEPGHPDQPIDPAAVEMVHTVPVTIDVSRLLQSEAEADMKLEIGELNSIGDLGSTPGIAPVLGLISRSLSSAIGILDLTHFRLLVVLNQKEKMSVAELGALLALPSRKLLRLLDSMEASGWIVTVKPARGVAETISISTQGRALVEDVTTQRQREIDELLSRMSDEDRTSLARAFESFAAAAREPVPRRPRIGLAP